MATDPPARRRIDTAAAVVEGAADGLADGIQEHGLDRSAPELARQAAPIAQRGARSERLRATLDKADEKVSRAIDATRTKARAVAGSARRARKAPAQVWDDLKDGGKAYAGGLAASAAAYAAAGLVAAIAIVLLTVGFVQGLNGAWGEPWGTFFVAAAYGAVAFGLVLAARGKAAKGRRTAKLRLAQARLELQRVADPVREAFRREPAPTTAFGSLDDRTTVLVKPSGPTPPSALSTAISPLSSEDLPGREP